ncbi:MAG: hypothetical protein ACI9C1_002754 [Candidatus Aldehydirespiratoraceae bacterium]|jgi:hypothetical protein
MSDNEDATQSLLEDALAALELGQKAANGYGRADLAERLRLRAEKIGSPALHVLVVGEFKQGKSSLVNSLVGHEICPVDDDIATAVPTLARYSKEPTATVSFLPTGDAADGDDPDGDRPVPITEKISMDQVPMYVVEQPRLDERRVNSVDVGVPSRFLDGGLVIVDTPGVGGLGSRHSAVTAGALPMAEAVLFVSDASQEFTAPEIEFMRSARKLCPNLVCVMTKTDFYPAWRKIRDLNLGHLERLGLSAEIFPVSSAVYTVAIANGDAALIKESGYQQLTKHIRSKVVADAATLSVRSAADELVSVTDHLLAPFAARKAALEDPDAAHARLDELEKASETAAELKSRAARWQQTLNDGMQDINTDVDHDLRGRFRKINQEAEEALAEADPADIWPEFEPWLYRRTAADVVANYEFLQERASDLAAEVADHFGLEEAAARVDLDVLDPQDAVSRVEARANIETDTMSVGQQAMTGLKGGYSGVLMFGMVGTMVGVALGPIGVGIGVLMGRKQVRDEKSKQMNQRRTQAKLAQRKYMEEASFLTTKDSRDALRRTQRRIRDFYTTRAEEHATSTAETLAAIKEVTRSDEKDRGRQLADAISEIGRLHKLRDRANSLSVGNEAR